jgi:hypothetical protein
LYSKGGTKPKRPSTKSQKQNRNASMIAGIRSGVQKPAFPPR